MELCILTSNGCSAGGKITPKGRVGLGQPLRQFDYGSVSITDAILHVKYEDTGLFKKAQFAL